MTPRQLGSSVQRGSSSRGRSAAAVALVAIAVTLNVLYLVGDRTWWGEWVSIWPPIGWVVLLLPALVGTRSRLGLALLLLLLGLYAEWPRFVGAVTPPDGVIRVVTWNVAGDARSWDHLRALNADLILVQESAGGPPDPWEGYEWHGTLDPGVLSRFPAEPLPTGRVGPWIEPQLLRVSIPTLERPLLLANVRLVLPSIVTWAAGGFDGNPRQGYETRTSQYQLLAALLEETRVSEGLDTVVLAGDFNAPARMPSLDPLRAFLTDAWTLGGRGYGATATSELPLARIDHCWVSDDVTVASAEVRRMSVSDHRLLVVDLVLPGRRDGSESVRAH